MILTEDLAEKAKALIDRSGICLAMLLASNDEIDLYNKDISFWVGSDYPEHIYKWKLDFEGDIKRRAFIDSLIGKDL